MQPIIRNPQSANHWGLGIEQVSTTLVHGPTSFWGCSYLVLYLIQCPPAPPSAPANTFGRVADSAKAALWKALRQVIVIAQEGVVAWVIDGHGSVTAYGSDTGQRPKRTRGERCVNIPMQNIQQNTTRDCIWEKSRPDQVWGDNPLIVLNLVAAN